MRRSALLFAVGLLPFVLLATANSAGYRYGAGDLAFYGPAVMRQLDPRLFPRDAPLITAQARLTLMDETVAALSRVTTGDLPSVFLGLYFATLVLLALGAALFAARLYRTPWAVAAFLAAVTLRHAIPKSGTNTLEGYFHPRQLAFAFGTIALAAFLRGRLAPMAAALAASAALHPTTTLGFAIWLAVATLVAEPHRRRVMAVTAAAAALLAAWALAAGPLAGRLVRMDPEWLQAIAEKDYLFPTRWPLSAWAVNLGYAAAIAAIYRWRTQTGRAVPREGALVAGCLSLAVVFLIAVAFNSARVALAIQLQPARVFWMLDFMAVAYGVWAAAEAASDSRRRAAAVAAGLVALSAARGIYNMRVDFPERPLFERRVPGDWGRVAAWAQTTEIGSGWVADPIHASRYGTSLRMAAGRDVFVEATKDSAIGMYDRAIALRTRDRLRVLDGFVAYPDDRARRLATEYDQDYLVTEQDLPLPRAFESGPIRVYSLR